MILSEEDLLTLKEYMRASRNDLERKQERLMQQMQATTAMEQLVAHVDDQQDTIDELNEDVAGLNAQIEKLQAQVTQLKGERDAQKQECATLKMQLDEQSKMTSKMIQVADQDNIVEALRKYINLSKRKTATKRGYIKMVVTEMIVSSKISVPEEMLNTLEHFDDDLQAQEKSQDADLMEKLTPVFWGNAEEAENFLTYVRGKKNVEITAKVNCLLAENKISPASSHHTLWTILHEAGLYPPSESNWNQQVD